MNVKIVIVFLVLTLQVCFALKTKKIFKTKFSNSRKSKEKLNNDDEILPLMDFSNVSFNLEIYSPKTQNKQIKPISKRIPRDSNEVSGQNIVNLKCNQNLIREIREEISSLSDEELNEFLSLLSEEKVDLLSKVVEAQLSPELDVVSKRDNDNQKSNLANKESEIESLRTALEDSFPRQVEPTELKELAELIRVKRRKTNDN